MLKLFLDGIEVIDEPEGTSELSERVYYSKELSGYLKELSGSVTFYGKEYDYLRDIFNEDVCGEVEVIIRDENREINGRILISDAKWMPWKHGVECEIIDDSYISRIDNNKKIKAFLNVGRSKNDETISTTLQTNCEFVDPQDANPVTNRKGVRVFDAFTFLIQFMSDGEIGFRSDYFDPTISTTNEPYLTIFTGKAINDGTADYAYLSFSDLVKDMIALRNLAWGIEVDGSNIYLRLEPKEYFKQATSSLTFADVHEFAQEIDTETFYSKVIFGSRETSDDFTYLQDIRFQAFQQEEYHLAGQCNIDNELNIKCQTLTTDTNIIQDILPVAQGGTNNDSYNDDIFLVQLDSSNKVVLTQKPASGTDFYFNESLTNREVALKWFGNIPQSIYAFLGSGNDWAYALLTSDQSMPPVYANAACDFTGSAPYGDPNGNYTVGAIPNGYNTVTAGYYTAPSNNVFSMEFQGRFTGLVSQVQIRRMSGSTVVSIEEIYTGNLVDELNGHLIEGGATFYMNSGERALVVFILVDGTLHEGATFQVFDPLGGQWVTYDSNDNYLIQNEFEYPVNRTDWENFLLSPYGEMDFSYNNGQAIAWLNEVDRNIKTGTAQVKINGQNG